MFKNIADELSLRLVVHKMVSIDDRKYYTYGIELALNDIVIFISLTIIAILSNEVLVSLVYAITYCLIRKYVGGYHCKTYMRCFCTTLTFYILMLLFNNYLGDMKAIISYVLICVSIPAILVFAPVNYGNDPINNDTKKKYRRKAILLLIIASAGFILANIFHKVDISFAIAWGIFIVFSLMLLSVFLNFWESRRKSNDEKSDAKISFPHGRTRN